MKNLKYVILLGLLIFFGGAASKGKSKAILEIIGIIILLTIFTILCVS